jgi:enoyl-CoA hydratase/carnithine racemase
MKGQAGYFWERKGTTGILTINNPPGNYIREPDFVETSQVESWLNDATLKGVLIKGADRHFSAGADLKTLKQLASEPLLLENKIRKGRELLSLFENAEVPVIAVIRRACFGAGLEIALACHIRICSENALFAFPEINHGLIPGLGGSSMLSDKTGEGRSLEILLSGNILDAQKAYELKIADYLVADDELDKFALKYLEDITRDRDPVIIRSIMRSIHNSYRLTFPEALEEETKMFCRLAINDPDKATDGR